MVTIRPNRTWRIVQQIAEPTLDGRAQQPKPPTGGAGDRSQIKQRTRHLPTLGQALAHARRWQLSRTSSYPVTVLMMLPNSRQCLRVTFRTYGVTRLVRDVGPAEVWFDQVVPAVQNRKTYILREPTQ